MIVLFFLIGLTMLIIGYQHTHKPVETKIVYRYIPRTFEESQNNPVKVSKIFSKMFEEPSPWIQGFHIGTKRSKIYRPDFQY